MSYLGHAHTRAGWDLALSDLKNMAERINNPSLVAKLFGPSRQEAVEDLRGHFRVMFDVMTPQELQQIIPQLIQDPAYSHVRALLAPEVQQLTDALRSSSPSTVGTPLASLIAPTPADQNKEAAAQLFEAPDQQYPPTDLEAGPK
ncbi:TPA: hypothetical protein ACRMSW_000057 [Pseudomonas aeruginosa]